MIEGAPDTQGVYVLWDEHSPLGVGHALGHGDTIQSRLKKHLEHARTTRVALVTHYSWEICRNPLRRQQELESELGFGRHAASAVSRHEESTQLAEQ